MAWAGPDGEKKPAQAEYPYNKQISLLNIIPNTSREFALLTGDLDPTKTWVNPVKKWVHSWKSQKGGTATYISMNYSCACPIAYENELFKLANPNYKAENKKAPYPISSKVLCPVWDKTLGKVSFLLAGREIEKQIEFILTNDPTKFKGFVRISRMGEGLNTTYRVDMIDPFELNMEVVASQMIPLQALDTSLTVDEFRAKTGIDPNVYWPNIDQRTSAGQIPPIDISGWGPRFGTNGATSYVPPVVPSSTPNPGVASGNPVVPPPMSTPPPQAVDTSGMTFEQLVEIKCTTGMFKDKTLGEAVKKSGLPIIQFLAKGGSEVEKSGANRLLAEFKPQLDLYIKGELF